MSEATKNIWAVAIAAVGSLIGSFAAIYATRSLEVEKIAIAKVEALTKLQPLLTSDNLGDREIAYVALRPLGFDNLKDSIIKQSLTPERLRINIQNERQRKEIGEMARKLQVPQSAINVVGPPTKFSDGVEVRYFDEKDWRIAHNVASLADPFASVRRGPSNTEKRGAIEVWVSEKIYDTYTFDTPVYDTYTYTTPKKSLSPIRK